MGVAACSLDAAMVSSAGLAPPLTMEFSSSGTPRTHGLFVTRGVQAGARRVLSAFPVRTMPRHLLTRAPRMELHVHHIRRQKLLAASAVFSSTRLTQQVRSDDLTPLHSLYIQV